MPRSRRHTTKRRPHHTRRRHITRRRRQLTRRRFMRGGFGPGSTITGTNGPNNWGPQPDQWPGAMGDHSGTYFKPSPVGIPSGPFQPPAIANGPLNTAPYPPSLQKGGGRKRYRARRGGGGISLVEDGTVFLRNLGNTMGNVLRGFQGVTPSISPSPTDQPIARQVPTINASPQAPINFKAAADKAIEQVNAL